MDIYEEMSKANLVLDNHCSDLLTPVNFKSQEIVERYEFKGNVTVFRNQIDGTRWFDIPFAYYPYHTKACLI